MKYWEAQEKLSKKAYKKYDRVWKKSDIHDEVLFQDYVVASNHEIGVLKGTCMGLCIGGGV